MKTYFLWLMAFSIILSGCHSEKEKNLKNDKITNQTKTLLIKGDIKNSLQVDSIFSDIRVIPLETNDKCLITRIEKAGIFQERLLLRDEAQRLLVFNFDGRFLYEIGKLGRGPDEFSELREFDVDSVGNVYILQYQKILKYDIDGKFLQSISFNFSPADDIICNPLDFAVNDRGRFYIWGGSLGITGNPDGKLFAMYEITMEGKILNKYFSLKHIMNGEGQGRYKHYENMIIMNPFWGSNMVYSFVNGSLSERYYIDFGRMNLDKPIPEDFNSIREFRSMVDQNYYHSISKFTETNEWIYFSFAYKMRVFNVFYSKELNKSFVSKQYPFPSGNITPWTITTRQNDNFISFIDPKHIIEQMDACKKTDPGKLPQSVKRNIVILENVKLTDNPVLVICSLRKY